MRIFNNLLKVIFWLTTIVTATDCCYSQILPRLNQNLMLIVQQKSEELNTATVIHPAAAAATTTTTSKSILHINDRVSSMQESDFHHQQQPQWQSQSQSQSERDQEQSEHLNDNSDEAFFFQIEIDKYLQHIKDFINSIAINPNKTLNGNIARNETHLNDNFTNPMTMRTTMTTTTRTTTRMRIIELPANINNTAAASVSASTSTTTTISGTNNDIDEENMKYNFLELYTFMGDTLSTSCSGEYASKYCLNNGQCFVHLVGLFYCKCAEGYVGERCESKYIYAMAGDYRPNNENNSNRNDNSTKRNLNIDGKKPKILSAQIMMPFRAVIVLIILYLSLSLLWSYKYHKHHHMATSSTCHLIY